MIPQALLCIFFFIFWPPLVSASGGDYIPYMDSRIYLHEKHPLICIFEPYDKSIQFKQRNILDSTLLAIGAWEDGLNRRTHSDNWNMRISYIPINGIALNDKCDVFILYQKADNATGFTQFDTNSSTIVIYTSTIIGKSGSIPIQMMRDNQHIQITIEHELGHTMGLNHLQTPTNDEKNKIFEKNNAEKSIMYYALDDLHEDPLVSIKNSDLDAVIAHYGGYGWGHITNATKYTID